MAVLDEISTAVTAVAERVGPAVVGLGRGWGRGSGVVIAPGAVITNAHNLRGEETTVTFGDGRRASGTVKGRDDDRDVAVIEVDTGDVEPVDWLPERSDPRPGGAVFALANPGGRGLRTTLGLVSASASSFRGPRGRRIHGSIEHTAPLPRGSSGGPLVDGDGRLLGLNTARLDGGLIVALPADEALRERVERLRRGEQPRRVQLGVAIAPPHVARRLRRAVGLDERPGLLVRGVAGGSPAEAAGLRKGDLIVAAAGEPVGSLEDLYPKLDAAGSTLELAVVRGADERAVSVDLNRGK